MRLILLRNVIVLYTTRADYIMSPAPRLSRITSLPLYYIIIIVFYCDLCSDVCECVVCVSYDLVGDASALCTNKMQSSKFSSDTRRK